MHLEIYYTHVQSGRALFVDMLRQPGVGTCSGNKAFIDIRLRPNIATPLVVVG